MMLPGEWAQNPLRLGSWSQKPVGIWHKGPSPWTWEIGICVALPLDRFPLGTEVALQLDHRPFRGRVVESRACEAFFSDGLKKYTAVTLEGKYVE